MFLEKNAGRNNYYNNNNNMSVIAVSATEKRYVCVRRSVAALHAFSYHRMRISRVFFAASRSDASWQEGIPMVYTRHVNWVPGKGKASVMFGIFLSHLLASLFQLLTVASSACLFSCGCIGGVIP